MDYLYTWGIYQGFPGIHDEMIDTSDREAFFAMKPNGKVFQCVSVIEGMLILQYGERKFKVNPKLYKVVCEPKYKLGDQVEIIEKSLIGKIIEINWHIKDNSPFYFLEIQGKKHSRRYRDMEIKRVDKKNDS